MSSLYLHIPFCSKKCPYCDFFSQVGSATQLDDYVELLNVNIQILKRKFPNSPPFKTVFFGGGTPSLLSATQVDHLLNAVRQAFGIEKNAEISLEANPGTVDTELLTGYRQAGINRLSLGIQSLNNRNLQLLGRIHTAEQALEAVTAVRSAGFDNLNLDLMFALPDQELPSLEQEIAALLQLDPDHISLYGLSFEEGTEFTKRLETGELTACRDSLYADQYRLLHDKITAAGFEHYEISNFARSSRRCRHNQVYWKRQTCLAIGCGAHGFYDTRWGERWNVPADLNRYGTMLRQGKDPEELLEDYDHLGAMKEFVYLGLRTRDGIDPIEFSQRFNKSPEQVFSAAFDKIRPFLQATHGCWSFNLSGWLLYDHLISYFL